MTSLDASVPEHQYGVTSMSAPLRRVMVRRPATAGDFAGADWRIPDPSGLVGQHEQFTGTLRALGCEVVVAPAAEGLVDATYIRDPGLMTARGAIVFQMAKPARQAEPDRLDAALRAAGVPVLTRLAGPARADGGDFIWLDHRTLLAGHSFRTNVAARSQIADALAPDGVIVEQVDLPYDRGPDHVLHLMSVISPVADDLAVVYLPLAPVALVEALAERGITIVAVPDEEYATMACNVLAVRPRVVVMLDGNPRTRAALEAHGCEVHFYDGSEISLKGDGGPTCLTAPLWRE